MATHSIRKLGDVDTPIGLASLLHVQELAVLSFPTAIDPKNTPALETYYGTLQWPKHLPLSRISELPPGPALPGYLLVSVEKIYTEQSSAKGHRKGGKPRHVREFLSNVLAGLAASLLIGKM